MEDKNKNQTEKIKEELRRQDAKDAMLAGGFAAGTVALFTALAALTINFFTPKKK